MNGHTSTKFLRPTIDGAKQTGYYVFVQEGTPYSRDSNDNIMFSSHLALKTCRDKALLTIPKLEGKLTQFLCFSRNTKVSTSTTVSSVSFFKCGIFGFFSLADLFTHILTWGLAGL